MLSGYTGEWEETMEGIETVGRGNPYWHGETLHNAKGQCGNSVAGKVCRHICCCFIPNNEAALRIQMTRDTFKRNVLPKN